MQGSRMTDLYCVAFVFARGGSKGIPGKNLQTVGGRSLVERSIDCGLDCPSIDRVYVSTDSDEIADVARRAGAIVPELRPASLAQDDSPELEAWRHAISWLTDDAGKPNFEVFVSLPPTAPLRTPKVVEECIAALDADCDMVVTGSAAARHPAFNMVEIAETGYVHLLQQGSSLATRRQATGRAFDLTTVAYVSRPKHILTTTAVLSGRVRLVEVNRSMAVDIDEEIDLVLARALLEGSRDD
jgi:CMP-N-acetylneuraminic acid synthetase